MSASDIARIKEQIRLEYEASTRVLEGFTPTAAHAYITKRQENIETCYTQLTQYMKPEEAIAIILQAEKDSSGENHASF
jgi:hypothetical protein